jgi:citrate/tricarballylate utilization protein
MPHNRDLLSEAQRQLAICNACRYCEGYCAVFPEIASRKSFAEADFAYLASLCHDCRACFQACPYTAPHEFAVDIPELMAAGRDWAWRFYTRPRFLASLFDRGRLFLIGATALGFALALLTVAAASSIDLLTSRRAGGQSFYVIVPHAVMVSAFTLLALGALLAMVQGPLLLLRDVSDGRTQMTGRVLRSALADILRLRYLSGGGGGCYFPTDTEPSQLRRVFHHAVFYGFGSAFAATVTAGVLQQFFHRLPPYRLLSAPVVLGMLGGVALMIGATGLGLLKVKEATSAAATGARAQDYVFLAALAAAAGTGILLLAVRATAVMGVVLLLHLAAVFALYLTAPYSRFVHVPYRVIALLLRSIGEAAARDKS